MQREAVRVLFLCTGNSARSILAESILNHDGKGRFQAYSAGSKPAGRLNPYAIALLQKLGYPTDSLRSKSWSELAAPEVPEFDFVVTVCDSVAGEACPIWLGKPMRAHWSIPDPAAVTGTEAEIAAAFADTYRMLKNRIDILINLPVDKLDALALKRQLDQIGQGG